MTDMKEVLTINDPLKGIIKNSEAQSYLNRLLPVDYTPFFFFDGEDIQSLAEANRQQTVQQMELLLNIRPMENVRAGIKDLRRHWKENAMDKEAKQYLKEAENRLDLLKSKIETYRQAQSDLQDDLEQAEEELNRVMRNLELARGYKHQENETIVKEQLRQLEERQGELLRQVSDFFERDAFLMFTPDLTQSALVVLEELSHNEQLSQNELIQALQNQLPLIFDQPPFSKPPLTWHQRDFYKQRLIKQLDVYANPVQVNSPFHIESFRAQQVLSWFATYSPDNKPAANIIAKLNDLRQTEADIKTISEKLQDIGNLSEAERKRYNELVETENELGEQILDIKDKQRDFIHKIETMNKQIEKEAKEIEKKRERVTLATEKRQRVEILSRLDSVLSELKEYLKQQKREELESLYNRHYQILMDANDLIDTITIGEDFQISYLDQNRQPVGMSNISAGMKQLSATALLWALKDTSDCHVPVVVDTPLGRIDRQHQHNLLTCYYPKAGHQVILLPTDSEIDGSKKKLLEPHIHKEFLLRNPTGKQTVIDIVNNGE